MGNVVKNAHPLFINQLIQIILGNAWHAQQYVKSASFSRQTVLAALKINIYNRISV